MTLLTHRELDRMLRYPKGRSLRLAKAGKIPCITLPDGEVRFDERDIERFLRVPPVVVTDVLEGEVLCAR